MLSDLGELKDVKGVFGLKNSQILANLPCLLATLRNLKRLAALRLAQRWRLLAM
ncbi:hypothetical protein VB002_02085 [Campylobacter concisus]